MNIKQISTLYIMILQLVFVALAIFFIPFSDTAAAEHCSDEYYVDERLPNGARWDMCWEHRNREGIVLHHVYYTPNEGQRRMVLNQASVAQIHVPYDDNGTRFHDVSDYGIGDLSMLDLTPADCPSGTLLKYSGKNVICKQVENRGFTFKKGNESVDGHNLVLFSVSPVAAYYYIPLWRFMDNGSIEPWLGATGALQRFGGAEYRGWKLGEGRTGISHLHNFFWKLDFDLNGTPKDDIVEEINFPLVDEKRLRTITTFDTEASRKVNPNTMRRWRIKDKVTKNSNNHAISYDIVLGETGHQDIGPASEPFTHNDFYVTKQNDDEIFASHNPHGGRNLAEFINGEKLDGSDIVIWTGVTFYHMPRSEDAPHMDAHWSHLQLIPRDWHASNPLGKAKTFNTPPTISPLKNQIALIGDLVNLSIKATDVDNDALVYSASNLPAGLIINKKTGVISGSLLRTSENSVQITVSDEEGKSTINFNWVVEVVFVNTPPQLESPDNQSGLVGDSINLSIQAKDSDVDNLIYSATGLPKGLVINGASGVISGSLSSAGNYTISLKVSDGTDTDTKSFIWSVIAPISNEVISQNIQIDGLFNDWVDKEYFENDSDDVTDANNQIDWIKVAIAHSPNNVYLTYQNRKNIDPSTASGSYLPRGWQTYLDTDSNVETGYTVGGIGADYLIDGANVLHYIGTGSSWSWESKGQVKLAYKGKDSEMSFSRVLIGNPKNIRVAFVGDNAVFNGAHKDRYPDTGFFRYAFTGDSLPNTPPVADGQEISVGSGASVSVILGASDSDNDSLTYKIATPPSHGSLSGSIPNLVYTANTSYIGEDGFTFKAHDGQAASQIATIKVKVLPDQTGLIVSNYIKHKMTIDGNASDWNEVVQFPDDTDDKSGVINWHNITFAHNDLSLYLLYKNRGVIDPVDQAGSYLTWGWQAYIDSDKNKATGFQAGGIGADFIIDGNQVLRYIGNGKNWSWKHVGQAQAQFNGKVAEMALSRSLIGNPVSINVLFMGNNKAYLGEGVDLYPDKQNDAEASLRYFNYVFSGDGGTDDRPVAFTQTVTVSSGSDISINLIAIDPDNDHLTYHVIAPPLHGTLTGVAPNLIYTPELGFAGQDDLRFNVNDGTSDSATVVVTINVNVTGSLGGIFTNPVSSIAIDGNNEEWNTLASFTDDPDDINEDDSLVNWQRATVAHNADTIYFMYKNYGVINPVANSGDYISREWLVYLDTDENSATGYKIGNMGADYLIEGSQLLQYTGKGSSWSWKFSAMASVEYNANIAELSINRTLIGNPDKISLVFVGDNRVYGGSVDSYPDNNNHFIYQLSEGNQLSTSRPVSNSQVVELKKNRLHLFTLSAVDQDSDELTYRVIRQPAHGELVDFKESGSISYRPNTDYLGTDSFSYVVNDGTYDSSIVTVSLSVVSTDSDSGTGTGSSGGNGTDGEESTNSNGSSSGGGGLLPLELVTLFIFIILLRVCFVGCQRKVQPL